MGSCNTTRNEKGGKDLLLKVCSELTVTIVSTEAGITSSTPHGLEVGDLVRFPTLDTLNDVVANQIYFVNEIVDTDTFIISASPGGAQISHNPGVTALVIEVFTTLGGLRSKSFSFSAEAIDVSNHGSNQWKQLLDEAGMRSVSVSGSGVYTSATNYRLIEANAFANLLTCFAFLDALTGRVYVGCFKITGVEATAEYDGEAGYSISADSAAEVSIYQAA
jgi:TP901-1 family phage major tail protein